MPRRSAASKPSRNVMTSVAPMALLRDDPSFGGLLVIIANEGVRARLERGHLQADGFTARNDLLNAEVLALELFRRRVFVGYHEHERLAGGNLDLLGAESVAFDGQCQFA